MTRSTGRCSPRPSSSASRPSNSRACAPPSSPRSPGSRAAPRLGISGATAARTGSVSAGSPVRASGRSAATSGTYGSSLSPRSTQSPVSTSAPLSRARSCSSASSRDLPTPDSPATIAIEGRSSAASASAASSSANSAARPIRRELETRVVTRRGSAGAEVERAGVDAVAHPARVARPVVEHVPEVAAAVAADDLRAVHAPCVVGPQLDRLGDLGLGEARPAGAGVELGVGREQLGAAARAAVHAVLVVVPVAPREGAFGRTLAQHVVLLGRELLTPLLISLLDSRFHTRQFDRDINPQGPAGGRSRPLRHG